MARFQVLDRIMVLILLMEVELGSISVLIVGTQLHTNIMCLAELGFHLKARTIWLSSFWHMLAENCTKCASVRWSIASEIV